MQLTVKDFQMCFGGMTDDCEKLISQFNFKYDPISYTPSFENLKLVGDKNRWENGWNENLGAFKLSHDVNDLTPKYYHPGRILRYKNKFIKTEDPQFEANFLKVFRQYIFSYLSDYNPIYEFGCGTAFNLVALAEMYPDKLLHGIDWASSSVQIINEINKVKGLHITPYLFDMFNPSDLKLLTGSAVFTWGALEQLGTKFEPFLEYLLRHKIFVINIEPLVELLDHDNPLDYFSKNYMQRRGYLRGYLTKLWYKNIEIIETQRLHFGNMNYEGWSFVIWRTK